MLFVDHLKRDQFKTMIVIVCNRHDKVNMFCVQISRTCSLDIQKGEKKCMLMANREPLYILPVTQVYKSYKYKICYNFPGLPLLTVSMKLSNNFPFFD